jgi:hypothetical protein
MMTNRALTLCILVIMVGAACAGQPRSEITLTIAPPTSPTTPMTVSQSSPLTTSHTPELSSEGIEENTEEASPTDRQMTLISGLVFYPEQPPYEVWYEAGIWQYTERADAEPVLVNREIPDCYLSLRGEATEATPISKAILAGREWRIYGSGWEPGSLHNSLYYSITEPGNYIFRVDLPEPYQAGEKSHCQQLAEEVIDTFAIVQE